MQQKQRDILQDLFIFSVRQAGSEGLQIIGHNTCVVIKGIEYFKNLND
jgi:hypothetical protein